MAACTFFQSLSLPGSDHKLWEDMLAIPGEDTSGKWGQLFAYESRPGVGDRILVLCTESNFELEVLGR